MLHRLRSLNPGSVYFLTLLILLHRLTHGAGKTSATRSGAKRKRLCPSSFCLSSFYLRRTSSTLCPLSLGLMGNMQKRLSLCSPQVINFQRGAGGRCRIEAARRILLPPQHSRRAALTSRLYITAAVLPPPRPG